MIRQRAWNIVVPVSSSRLQFSSPPADTGATWVYQEGMKRVFTATPGAWVSLTFQGSAIAYRAFHNTRAGSIALKLDNNPYIYVDGSAGMNADDDSSTMAVLWSISGLSAGTHTLNASLVGHGQDGGVYMDLVNFEYNPGSPAASASPIRPHLSAFSTPLPPMTSIQTAAKHSSGALDNVPVPVSAGRFATRTAALPESTLTLSSGAASGIGNLDPLTAAINILSTNTQSGSVVFQTVTVSGEGEVGVTGSGSSANGAIIGGVLGAICLILLLLVLGLRRRRQVDAINRLADVRPLILQTTMRWDEASLTMDSLANLTVDTSARPIETHFGDRNVQELPNVTLPETNAISDRWVNASSGGGEKSAMMEMTQNNSEAQSHGGQSTPLPEDLPPPPYARS